VAWDLPAAADMAKQTPLANSRAARSSSEEVAAAPDRPRRHRRRAPGGGNAIGRGVGRVGPERASCVPAGVRDQHAAQRWANPQITRRYHFAALFPVGQPKHLIRWISPTTLGRANFSKS